MFPEPLELSNRYQVLAEKSDSEDELESEWKVVPSRLTRRQNVSPLPVTSAHTGNGVMQTEGENLPKLFRKKATSSRDRLKRLSPSKR